MLLLLIILALVFAFINGYRDSSSILAGVIASRALPPRSALILSGIAEFIAPFLFGTAVAQALTTNLVHAESITIETIVIALAAALAWTLFAWFRGIPSSSSHALVGGILGAVLIDSGPGTVITGGLLKVLLALFLAPIVGIGIGLLTMHIILYAFRNATPKVNQLFQRLQIVTMFGLALSHSANDAQKSMGMIALGMLLAGRTTAFQIPFWVIVLCAAAIAFGASRGDWRLMQTLGRKIYRVRPINALASQSASAAVVMVAAIIGAPVSTSQVISMALLGSGAAERVNKVRWQIGGDMLVTWILTIPVTMAVAAGIFLLTNEIVRIVPLVTQLLRN